MLKNWFEKSRYGLLLLLCLLQGCQTHVTGVLNPKGLITFQERQLLFDSLALMMIVVLPVIIMSIVFIVRYRENHPTADYKPNWCHSTTLEAIWWGVPMAIILILGIMTWTMTHELDPYKRIDVPGEPIVVQAVALPWKWLFIYPEQNIATINYLQIPKGRQVEFWLTTDNVPMSSFFIPQLGSQIYAMAGMRTRLHLIATHLGQYEGLNAQYNGDGFSHMNFKVDVVPRDNFAQWMQQMQSHAPLDNATFKKLRQASIDHPVEKFAKVDPNLYHSIIESYRAANHPQ